MDKTQIDKWFEDKLKEIDNKIKEIENKDDNNSIGLKLKAEYDRTKSELKKEWAESSSQDSRQKFKLKAESWLDNIMSKINDFRSKNM